MLASDGKHWVLDASMDEDRAQPQGQRRGLPGGRPAAGSEYRTDASRPKRSVRREFLNAMWRNDLLLDMIRHIRNHE